MTQYVEKIRHSFVHNLLKRRHKFNPVTDSVAISMVRNEQDIIEPFIRHNSKFFDLMVVLDNGSDDRTKDILLQLSRELQTVIVVDWPDRAYNQAATMTRVLHAVQSAVFADFVFFLDADEFLDAPSKSDLLASLSYLKAGCWGYIGWRTVMPDPDRDEMHYPELMDRMVLMRASETPQYYKTVLRFGGAVDPHIQMTQGNHDVIWPSARKGEVIDGLSLLHMPVRSAEQILAKGAIGWQANLARPNYDPTRIEGGQWKRLHDLQMGGLRPDKHELLHEARIYAQDMDESTPSPIRLNSPTIVVDRKYSDGKFADASSLIELGYNDCIRGVGPLQLPGRPAGSRNKSDIKNAFDGSWHWDSLFLDEPPIRCVVDLLQPRSVLDVGCGIGLYPTLFGHLGVPEVLGIDGVPPESSVLDSNSFQQVDLQQPVNLKRKFDLVVCLEVVEHIDPEATKTILDTIERHAGHNILFSMAEPDQPGHGHINCHTISEVIDMWQERGWHPDVPMSLGLRAVSSLQWFRRNLLLLRKAEKAEAVDRTDRLREIGSFAHKWTGQQPGQRATAFGEQPFEPQAGYTTRVYR